MRDKNPFLAGVMGKVREGRPLVKESYFVRTEYVPAGRYVEVWFQTRGCSWDHQGGCTMCNYGEGRFVSDEWMVGNVAAALDTVEWPVEELMVSPSGSMLDEVEVPKYVRTAIYEMVAARDLDLFLIETREDSVTHALAAELVAKQPAGRRVAIEIGLESCDPWVRRFCINKGVPLSRFVDAVDIARHHGIIVYANVCLGTPFLTARQQIEDALTTVQWALRNGANKVVIFPLHIKPFTLLDRLYEWEMYDPTSLWSLVEILRRLDPGQLHRVEIAWYKNYYSDSNKVRIAPGVDNAPPAEIIAALDRFRAEQSLASLEDLLQLEPAAREQWLQDIHAEPAGDRRQTMAQSYDRISDKLSLQWQWRERFPDLLAEMLD